MALSVRCSCGRSQFLLLVDRTILEQVFSQLDVCHSYFPVVLENSIFVESLKAYLETLSSREAVKALTLVQPWLDTVPEAFEEISKNSDKAIRAIKTILDADAEGEE